MGAILKRSVVVSGKKTSISLEPEFWHEIKLIGRANGGIGNFITGIKLGLGSHPSNLSSALRVAVLTHLKRIATESAVRATLAERSAPVPGPLGCGAIDG